MSVYLLATLDTKGHEAAFLRDRILSHGVDVKLVDTGCVGEPLVKADISREQVYQSAGVTLTAMQSLADRGQAVTQAARGAATLIRELYSRGQVSGVISLGGSAGTTIGTAAMRSLPVGVPKLMISTLASGQVRQYVGDKDILMLNSIVDIVGVNSISRPILANAARAMAGMASPTDDDSLLGHKPVVAATMFGVTTPCITVARQILEEAGYEVLVFHATGNGGRAMESLIEDGLIEGVLDITTTELADELVGGVLSAGPQRLTAAARLGVPQVVSVGAMDMVNFHGPSTVPKRFKDRKFYQHNPSITLMRTTVDENATLGAEIGHKVAASIGPAAVMLPLKGVSAIDKQGQPFDDPAARQALYAGVRANIGPAGLVELPYHINDPEFAAAAAKKLMELMRLQASAK